MTTAHRPTFDPARGKDALRGPAYHQRLQPAHTQLKFRKAGQGGDGDRDVRDLRSELLQAEAAHLAKLNGGPAPSDDDSETSDPASAKRPLELTGGQADGGEDAEAKRRRILEESRDIDADDSEEDDEDDDSEDDSDDDDDETAELQRELEKIKRERAEKREREEREKAAAEQEEKERDIALGNPLLNKPDFNIKRRWDDDVVFKNQARGTDDREKKKEFINDMLRSDFHRRFMSNLPGENDPPSIPEPFKSESAPVNMLLLTARIGMIFSNPESFNNRIFVRDIIINVKGLGHRMAGSDSLLGAPSPDDSAVKVRRNTACVNCRDSKVKCNASSRPNQSCLRCTKLDIPCVVDKAHKRKGRRSKFEELQREVLSIKEAVGKSVAVKENAPALSTSPQEPRLEGGRGTLLGLQPRLLTRSYTPHGLLPASVNPLPSATTAPSLDTGGQVPQPRALKFRVFSGEDIAFYFEKYFEYYHDYFPIVRNRDADKCYENGPVLFWTILITASRRFAKDDTVLPFLTESLPPDIWAAVATPPISVEVLEALLLLCAWPWTTIRFIADPSSHYMSLAMTSCYLLGLQTGCGKQPDMLRPNYQIKCSDEEAAYTWAGANIMTQKVSSYIGIPPSGPLFNKTIENLLDGTVPTKLPLHFSTLLECTRFSNRVSKTMCAALDGADCVSPHLIYMLEEEFNTLLNLRLGDLPDLDHFTLQTALLDLQCFYFVGPQHPLAELTQRNLLKAFNTAHSLVERAARLHKDIRFLSYAPHFVCRSLLLAGCITILTVLAPQMRDTPIPSKTDAVQDAISALKCCSIVEGDLPWRGAKMLESYWSFCQRQPRTTMAMDTVGAGQFSHRLGTSLTFECLRQWKKYVEQSLPATNTAARNQTAETSGVPADQGNTSADVDMQFFDWDALMNDFDWSFMPDVNPSLPV